MTFDLQASISQALQAHERGDFESAWSLYQSVLEHAPGNPTAFAMMGVIRMQLGQLDDAEALLAEAAQLDPDNANTLFNLALVIWQDGRATEAKPIFERAAAIDPKGSDSLNMLGRIALDEGLNSDAADHLKKATRLQPKNGRAWLNLCSAYHNLGDYAAAKTACRKARVLLPNDPSCPYNFGGIFLSEKNYEEAERAFREALALDPQHLGSLVNLGVSLVGLYRPEEAEAIARQAVEIAPDDPLATGTLALALTRQGRSEEAIPVCEKTYALAPDDAAALSNLACEHLANGHFDRGWPLFEEMLVSGSRADKVFLDIVNVPRWRGEPVDGKHLIVSGEQGIGEQIMFATMIPELLDAGASVTYACDIRLAPLMARSLPGATIAAAHEWEPDPNVRYDYVIPVGSLAPILRPTFAAFAQQRPMLIPDPALTRELREKYQDGSNDRVIGVSWRSTTPLIGLDKTLSLDEWGDVFSLPGCRFVSVQYGNVAADCQHVERLYGVPMIDDPEIDALKSIEQSAAQIAACDAIVSTSNATLHISGGADVPSFALIGRDPNWYWRLGDDVSPWYRSVRLFRQSLGGAWGHTVRETAAAISDYLASRAD